MLKLFGIRKVPKPNPSSKTKSMESKLSYSRPNREAEHFLTIFPELVWYRIIDHLHDNNSLQNVINSSPFFRQLLLQKRVHFLFKDVFQVVISHILGKHYCFSMTLSHRWKNENKVKSLILNCRLVCQSWNKAVIELAEQVDPEWSFGVNNPKKYAVSHIISKSYEFSLISKFDKFMERFDDPQINPFLGRTVLIKVPAAETPDILPPELFYKIFVLFQTFGDHIHSCGFILLPNFDNFSAQEVYLKLLEVLWSIPNVRNLLIHGREITDEEFSVWKSPPHFSNLESLELHFIYPQVCNLILQENTHVTSLTVHQSSKCIDFRQMVENQHTLESSCGENRSLQGYNSTNWPLKALHLIYTRVIDDSIRWSDLFGILSVNFGGTLEELELSLPEEFGEEEITKIEKDSLRCRLNLPKVKRFYFTVRNESSFDFLLGMTESLETLHISKSVSKVEWKKTGKSFFTRKSQQSIKILGYNDDKLLKSFIWILFPKLKNLRLSGFGKVDYQYYRNGEKERINSSV